MKKEVDVFVFGNVLANKLVHTIDGREITEATAVVNPNDYDLSKCAVVIKGDVMIDDIQVRNSIAATGCIAAKCVK